MIRGDDWIVAALDTESYYNKSDVALAKAQFRATRKGRRQDVDSFRDFL